MNGPVAYLDNNATTRLDPRVLEAMLPVLTEQYGNPASMHHFGAQVGALVEEARDQIARLLGARDSEIIFTSGGTEADNAALRGVLAARPERRHLVISAIEHPAISEPAAELARAGYRVTTVGVDGRGLIDLGALADALDDDTALVSVMLVNNETGVVQPLRQVAELARDRGALVHTDAVQAIGKLPGNVNAWGVDLLSLSAHKLHGPKGVGALYVRRGTPFVPLIVGGGQERQRRGGTLNTPGIVGLGAACRHATSREPAALERLHTQRARLEAALLARIPRAVIVGAAAERVANTTCICCAGVPAEPLVLLLSEQGVCVSSGAACSSGALEPSPILRAMCIPSDIAQGQVRISLSRFTTDEEIDRVIAALPAAVAKVATTGARAR